MASEEWYRTIHERLLALDPVASTELADAVWTPLVKELRKRHPRLNPSDLLLDAAADAVMNYIKRPRQFDPDRRGLFDYLVMSAEGDLRNALAKASRRKRVEISVDDVELFSVVGKESLEKSETGGRVTQEVRERIAMIFRDPRDREALELIFDGERSTAVFARVWGLRNLSAKEQALEVKRQKDRVKKMLQRHMGRSHGRSE